MGRASIFPAGLSGLGPLGAKFIVSTKWTFLVSVAPETKKRRRKPKRIFKPLLWLKCASFKVFYLFSGEKPRKQHNLGALCGDYPPKHAKIGKNDPKMTKKKKS